MLVASTNMLNMVGKVREENDAHLCSDTLYELPGDSSKLDSGSYVFPRSLLLMSSADTSCKSAAREVMKPILEPRM